jgi:hypothetical protein
VAALEKGQLKIDLSRWSADDLEAVANALNGRPRKTLGWRTPAEALNQQLLSLQQAGVATTGGIRAPWFMGKVREHTVSREEQTRRQCPAGWW